MGERRGKGVKRRDQGFGLGCGRGETWGVLRGGTRGVVQAGLGVWFGVWKGRGQYYCY